MKQFLTLLLLTPILLIGAENPILSLSHMMHDVGQQKERFTLQKLPYPYNALEPEIDAETMELHYNRHHRGYVNALNEAIQTTEWKSKTLQELLKEAKNLPPAIKNNAGGHWNHTFYWCCLNGSNQRTSPSEKLKEMLVNNFGSIELFREAFIKEGKSVLGSGWLWLVQQEDGSLKITSTIGQDNPLMQLNEDKNFPILACDLWEHSYYLKYQNHRDDYLSSFFGIVNWDFVEYLLFKEKRP